MFKGWLKTVDSPEEVFAKYLSTRNNKYLEQIVSQFNEPLYHYLLSQSDVHLAKDVLQTCWLKILKCDKAKFEHTSVRNWLFTIARNTLIDELRRLNRWKLTELDSQYILVTESENDSSMLEKFNQTLEKLPFYQKEAFILQQEGFSLIEIAMITNEPQETIKSRIRYARNTLKANLERLNEQ